MKFIKGLYEKKLRTHEDIKNRTKNEKANIFYYLQDNGNFTYSLRIYNELAIQEDDENEFDFEDRVNIFVCNLDQRHNFTNLELKNKCIEYIKKNNINCK